jgi:hypothetical protein
MEHASDGETQTRTGDTTIFRDETVPRRAAVQHVARRLRSEPQEVGDERGRLGDLDDRIDHMALRVP